MFTRNRYQRPKVHLEDRKRSPGMWFVRWRETTAPGVRVKRKHYIGSKVEYPTRASAQREADKLDFNNNAQTSAPNPQLMTVRELAEHYIERELSEERHSRTDYTCDVYRQNIRTHILPRWGECRVVDVKSVAVEDWLRSLPLANSTKAKVRNVFSNMFTHARRHELASANPIAGLVRQSAKRRETPEVLTADEMRALLPQLSELHRIIVLILASVGLRFSELRGVQWQDVDFATGTLKLTRGRVKGYTTPLKSAASRKPTPLHPNLMAALAAMRKTSPFNQPENWIFASPAAGGRVPIWPTSLMEDYIRPAAVRAGIEKHITWHVFRHTLATSLSARGENVKTVQDAMRHANSHITMDIYTQAVQANVRAALDGMFETYTAPAQPELAQTAI